MKDVAREAGVSLGTVSRVINGMAVGEPYRVRVEDAIRKLGYQVNSFARSLKTNRTDCVALLIPSLYHPFYAILTDELTACLMRRGRRSLLMLTNYDPDAERKCFRLAQQNKVDGVIALTYAPEPNADESIPVVTIDRHFGSKVPCVSSDNFHGGELAAEQFLALGCRRLLFMRIGPEVAGEPDKRGAGFENLCRMRGVSYETIVLNDKDTVQPFFAFLEEHLHGGRLDFDGIFCHADWLACRVRAFLTERGIRVPEDVQIIGYDGIKDYATGLWSCSTVVQPVAKMAETAVDILLDPDRAFSGETVCLPVTYVPGGTTKEQ